MHKCYDNGTMQAFLDGELAPDLSLKFTSHVAECDACALALAEAEEESSLVFAALESEYNTLVPTMRLWTKINDSIVEEKKKVSIWQKIRAFAASFAVNPAMPVAAAMLIVFSLFAAFLLLRPATETQIAAVDARIGNLTSAPPTKFAETAADSAEPAPPLKFVETAAAPVQRNSSFVKTTVRDAARRGDRKTVFKMVDAPRPEAKNFAPAAVIENAAYFPGEESYVKTIANLTQTVGAQSDGSMRPSAQVSFARNLAVVDDAIRKMQAEVRRNPKNEAARQVLYASYQNKIDLLNSVAERGELLASLK